MGGRQDCPRVNLNEVGAEGGREKVDFKGQWGG